MAGEYDEGFTGKLTDSGYQYPLDISPIRKDTIMQFAVNYSPQAAELVHNGQVTIDRFKCPAWPDLINSIPANDPIYVHFPLRVGLGIGDAEDTETHQIVDWRKMEKLLEQTGTPYVNVHLGIQPSDYPDWPVTPTADAAFSDMLIENAIRDLEAVVRRFGADKVMAENDHAGMGYYRRETIEPEFISRVIEETGCGFLLDLSHARLAARSLGEDAHAYINRLPVKRLREVHVTGIQMYDDTWQSKVSGAGLHPDPLQWYSGHLIDHLPMTDLDWDFVGRSIENIHTGQWHTPWIVSFEYGGVGALWQALTDQTALHQQIPRLYDLVHPVKV